MQPTLNKIGHWFATLRWRYVLTWFTLIVLFITVVYPAWMSWARYMKTIGPPHALSIFKYTDFLKIETDKTTLAEVTEFFGEPRELDEDVKVRFGQFHGAGLTERGTIYRWKDRYARVELRVDEHGIVRFKEYGWADQ